LSPRIGVCSWSLEPEGPRDLAEKLQAVGAEAVQLAIDPIRCREWSEQETVKALRKAGIPVVSGMVAMLGEDYSSLESIRETGGIRPDAFWDENRAAAASNAQIAMRFDMKVVSFHAGHLPESRRDEERAVILERIRAVSDCFAAGGIDIGLETGQESADTLLDVIEELDRPRVGVNFDPANMILYGTGDPVESLSRLAPHVHQVHIKDAAPASKAGRWGRETAFGKGAVDWDGFFDCLARRRLDVDWIVECESGTRRIEDVRRAITALGKRREEFARRRAELDREKEKDKERSRDG